MRQEGTRGVQGGAAQSHVDVCKSTTRGWELNYSSFFGWIFVLFQAGLWFFFLHLWTSPPHPRRPRPRPTGCIYRHC